MSKQLLLEELTTKMTKMTGKECQRVEDFRFSTRYDITEDIFVAYFSGIMRGVALDSFAVGSPKDYKTVRWFGNDITRMRHFVEHALRNPEVMQKLIAQCSELPIPECGAVGLNGEGTPIGRADR